MMGLMSVPPLNLPNVNPNSSMPLGHNTANFTVPMNKPNFHQNPMGHGINNSQNSPPHFQVGSDTYALPEKRGGVCNNKVPRSVL